ncbi:hypothetical protein Tco_0817693, partial [Tanacetum coccineum]
RSPQLEGEIIKKDNVKKAMYYKDAEEEDIRSDSDEDANLTVIADLAKHEVELGRDELVDLLGRMGLVKSSLTSRPVTYTWLNEERSTQRFKSSILYEDHPAKTVLNEPILGMILFNSFQRQDFVTIEDFGDLSNEMLYIMQEIFFRLH